MILVTIGSLAFGVYEYTKAQEASQTLESANARAVAAESMAMQQTIIAEGQREMASRAAEHARQAQYMAEQARAQAAKALEDCKNRRK